MKFFSLIIALLLSTQVTSQTNCDCYERLEGLAHLQSYEGKHTLALETYKKALAFLPESTKNYTHHFNLSLFFLKNEVIDSAAFYLKKSIEGGYAKNYLLYDTNFDSLRKTTEWNQIIETHRKVNGNFNWELYKDIQGLRAIDQSVRSRTGIGQLAKDSLSRKDLFYTVDSIVFEKVIELINIYGYPTEESHGFTENYGLYFLHSSMYSEEKFQLILQHMEKQRELCSCHKGNIALLIDRRLNWYHKKEQIAGTWNFPGEYSPIDNAEIVDSIRFEYNLLSLHDWGKITGKLTPEDYIQKKYPANYFCENKIP